jgi:hypothetical protein
MKNNDYINKKIHDIKQAKRHVIQKDTDYMFLSDSKNGVVCHYSEKINGVEFCSVSERLPINEGIVKDGMENFWDSQPEHYRNFYENLN